MLKNSMADEEKIKPGNDIEEAKKEAKAEIDKANKAGGPIEISNAQKELAKKYLNELAAASSAAKEVQNANYASGGVNINAKKTEAVEVKKTLVKVLEAIKEGVIPVQTNSSKIILTELAERGGLTDTTASYLQPRIEKYINKDIFFSKQGQELT